METLKNVYPSVSDFNSLYRAHLLARRGKRGREEVIKFELELSSNLNRLHEELRDKTYKTGQYRTFVISEPKKRLILSLPYRDRVVQHSLCGNVLEPLLDRKMIHDNCASRRGRGTHFGLQRLTGFLREHYHRHGTTGWFLKGDIKAYFYTINHELLKEKLYRYIGDKDLLWLLDSIIDSTNEPSLQEKLKEIAENHDLPVITTGQGLPIGNLTSQWFAVFYLDGLDRYIKEELKIPYYSRYMDDFVLIHPDREYMKECLALIDSYLRKRLDLRLNPKTQIFPVQNGVDYLGFHTYLTETGKVIRKLRRSSKKRIKRKVRKFNTLYAAGDIGQDSARQSLASWLGHARHGHTWHLQAAVLKKVRLKREQTKQLPGDL